MNHFSFLLFSLFLIARLQGQSVSTFENLPLEVDTFWNGIDQSGGFDDGNAFFPNFYSTDFGGFWASGWAYSNVQDSLTLGFFNLYGAKPAGGAEGSSVYAVGQQNAVINLTGDAAGKVLDGIFVTNGTFAFNSMRDGDAFAKKFGGESGDDPDFFKLTIRKYLDGELAPDSVDFYLADYRFVDNAQDFIVGTWEWVDLKPLGRVDSLLFTLSSSDVGDFGINTPLFFCIDNLTPLNPTATTDFDARVAMNFYPNPAQNELFLQLLNPDFQQAVVSVFDIQGRRILMKKTINETTLKLDLTEIPTGTYTLMIENESFRTGKIFIKN